MEYARSGNFGPSTRPTLLLETKTNKVKAAMLKAIKDDNLAEVKELMTREQILPNEELSKYGYFWNSLHYAGNYGRATILEYMIERLYAKYGETDTKTILNFQTREGWSVLMLSCIYDSVLCVKVLLKMGGVKIIMKDAMGRNVFDLCRSYGQIDCFELIHQAQEVYGDEIPLNKPYLEGDIAAILTTMSQNQNNEYHYLFLNGIALPCVICHSNKGYLKYTQCCSHPVHLVCFNEQPNASRTCVKCSKSPYNITREIRNPELAFTLPKEQLVELNQQQEESANASSSAEQAVQNAQMNSLQSAIESLRSITIQVGSEESSSTITS